MGCDFSFSSYCWSLGTTSFRMRNFNKAIEEQLALLDGFWNLPENRNERWRGNNEAQTRYYLYMLGKGFIEGMAPKQDKDAREKTSGLKDLGLVDEERRLTGAGRALLRISADGRFSPDNLFRIDQDSYIYLKQLLKTSCRVGSHTVRPFLVILHLLARFGSLTFDEFAYLAPLCVSEETTRRIVDGIGELRAGRSTVDQIIIETLMNMRHYQNALNYLLDSETTKEVICQIGMNRKSKQYDSAYFPLYESLRDVFVNGDLSSLAEVHKATLGINIGIWWRNLLFGSAPRSAIAKSPKEHLRSTIFDDVSSEESFKSAFFETMHLLKAKATLSDYFDLNRRYVMTSGVALFEDGTVRLDSIPKYFFEKAMPGLAGEMFSASGHLGDDCPLTDISPSLDIGPDAIIDGVNDEYHVGVSTIDDALLFLDDRRYVRFKHLIDKRFTDEKLLKLLDSFESRDDAAIIDMVTDNADIPTIFEYIVGILWYKISEEKGKILDYMKLSLDADLLPKSQASGGEADIVYSYEATDSYPRHTLLLEATLTDRNNQRRMEMEPVSRHLGNYLLRTGDMDSYCVFIAPCLNINVVSDFRSRRNVPYYDVQDPSCGHYVTGMEIIPLETSELKAILKSGKTYKSLYPIFRKALDSELPPHQWYKGCIKDLV